MGTARESAPGAFCGNAVLDFGDDTISDGVNFRAVRAVVLVVAGAAPERLSVRVKLDPINGKALRDVIAAVNCQTRAAVMRGIRRAVRGNPSVATKRRCDDGDGTTVHSDRRRVNAQAFGVVTDLHADAFDERGRDVFAVVEIKPEVGDYESTRDNFCIGRCVESGMRDQCDKIGVGKIGEGFVRCVRGDDFQTSERTIPTAEVRDVELVGEMPFATGLKCGGGDGNGYIEWRGERLRRVSSWRGGPRQRELACQKACSCA